MKCFLNFYKKNANSTQISQQGIHAYGKEFPNHVMRKKKWGKIGRKAVYLVALHGRKAFFTNVACNAQGTENMEIAGGNADI